MTGRYPFMNLFSCGRERNIFLVGSSKILLVFFPDELARDGWNLGWRVVCDVVKPSVPVHTTKKIKIDKAQDTEVSNDQINVA